MKKYWIFPLVACAALAGSMVYAIKTNKPPQYQEGVALLADGTKIEAFRIDDADALDRHKLAIFSMTPGKTTGLTLAIHLNGPTDKIIMKVGEFEVSKYCSGSPNLTCEIPLPLDGFERSQSLGVAAYRNPGQLLEVRSGRADWDGHRALFRTNGYYSVP